jgi:hypothetical protein
LIASETNDESSPSLDVIPPFPSVASEHASRGKASTFPGHGKGSRPLPCFSQFDRLIQVSAKAGRRTTTPRSMGRKIPKDFQKTNLFYISKKIAVASTAGSASKEAAC